MSLTSVLTQTSLFLRFAQLFDYKGECAIKHSCVAQSSALVTLCSSHLLKSVSSKH